PDGPGELPGKQPRAVEVRERQALLGEMDQEHADAEPAVARSQGAYFRSQGRRLSRRQALLGAHAAAAGVRQDWALVQSRQSRLLRSLHRDAARLPPQEPPALLPQP